MKIPNWLKGNEGKAAPDEKARSEPQAQAEPTDAFALGWYWSDKAEEHQLAKIKETDRSTHVYVVGASGAGKSKFLEFLLRQDVGKGNGFGVVDPHGDLIEELKGYLSLALPQKESEERIVLIDPANEKYNVFFNPLEKITGTSSAEISAELVEAFKKIWRDSWGARMEDLIRNTFVCLIEAELTLNDLPAFLENEDFRLNVLEKVKHPIALQYFRRFDNLSPKTRDEWTESTLNKVNAFLSDDRIRSMLSGRHSSFNLREIMDKKCILLLKLDKGRLKENADLLGSLFLSKIKMAAFSRSDIPNEKRVPFYLYLDEFQNFATDTFIETLAEARKYGLSLIMAHQNLSQLPPELQDSILSNCGIQICFRVSRRDAERLAKESFATTGKEVKGAKLSVKSFDYDYYSYQEEWERYFQELQTLQNRFFYVKHKIQGGIILLQTDEIYPAYEIFGIDKEKWRQIVDETAFGKKYLRERKSEKEPEKEMKTIAKPEAKQEKKDKSRTLEEITATLTPLEKAVLYAVGTGNYFSSDIFEQGNKELKKMGASTRKYEEFKRVFYDFSKLPPQGKGLVEFSKRGRSFCYWLSEWGEIAFAGKFGMPSDRAINELGGGGKLSRSVALELIKEWLEPQGYEVSKEDMIETDINLSKKGYTDLIARKDGETLRIEIEHRSSKKQIETNVRKNLQHSDVLYEIASDELAKKKIIQVALKVLFRLRKEEPNRLLKVRIGTVDEQKKNGFKEWFEVGSG